MNSSSQSVWRHRFTLLTGLATVFLLTAGALVTSNDAGDAVPDWPLSYGSLLPPMVGNIFYEHGHRMVAGFVLILTLVLTLWTWLEESRPWMRRVATWALAAVLAQALLGGLRVLYPHLAKPIALFHAILAQGFLCVVVAMTVFTSRWWHADLPRIDDEGSPRIRLLVGAGFGLTFLQLFLGATFRHFKYVFDPYAVIAPHILNAFLVLAVSVLISRGLRTRFATLPAARKAGVLFSALVGTQIVLGLGAFWTVLATRTAPQPMPIMVWTTVAHLVVGALTLAVSVVLLLVVFRQVRAVEAEVPQRERAVA
jgi:cytochrome c oxidase assembly protein subunit 15